MNTIEVRVEATRLLTPVVREFTLVAVHGRLPKFSSGSHIQVQLPLHERPLRNAYSLLGDPASASSYRIAVRKQDDSRGGSVFMHERLREGSALKITPPANLFALHSGARAHILIAGGIGITPFVAHVAALERDAADFELHYAYRQGLTDAYRAELSERLGSRFHGYDSECARLDIERVLRGRPLGTHVYVCGPQALLDSVQDTARALGWPDGRVHWEAFAAPRPGTPFVVTLMRSGSRLDVAADQSLLEALEASGLDIPNLCRGGVCGRCSTRHVAGEVDHRDLFLHESERATHLMPCVSRAHSTSLFLDL
ncbi:ferredoxin-NADP reductase [Paraburkholderia sp. GAS448]|jgi:ferredoxin-NADP reductase|uniref:PDR/VanB family oxidoreductase n=1 Tax=Paraburkholderia sp. GAS448 TaxID=3035136 RepID=UPI003D1D5A18